MPATLLRSRPAQPPAPPRKALYLATRSAVRVCAEGESLVVQRQPAGRERFPLARIARVVCNAHADWSGAALALCLARGIVVTWLDGRGQPLGECLPRLAEASRLDGALELAVELHDWPARYGNFLRRCRMRVLVGCAVRRKAAGTPMLAGAWEALKREYVYNGHVDSALPAELFGWCRAAVASQLAACGLKTRYWGWDAHPLELAEDLAHLAWAELNLDCGGVAAGGADTRTAVLMFEAGAAQRQQSLADHLGHLHRFVARTLESWP